MPRSTCLKCFALIPHGQTYCAKHTKPRAKPKASRVKRGLDYTYDKHRKVTLSLSGLCILCGRPGANSADHIIPRKHGGDNSLWNLGPAHRNCNYSRGSKPLTEFQMRLVNGYRIRLMDAVPEHKLREC